jgi:branched-chain amino acid transport system ATP-binding protein
MLEIHDLQVYYGGIHALQGVSLEVPDGKIVSLIGANGAGKSTTLNSIIGLVKPQSGSIKWNGTELTSMTTKDIVSSGIALVPEGRRVFPNLTVRENLSLGAYHRSDKAGIEQDRDMIYELFPRLKEREKQSAGTLSGGEQQMLAVGRGLMTKPKLFMLDEPSLGLAPLVVKNIFEIIRRINSQGTTVLLIEQNAKAALKIADFGYVMETGNITLSGTGAELLDDPRVQSAYLGSNSQHKHA